MPSRFSLAGALALGILAASAGGAGSNAGPAPIVEITFNPHYVRAVMGRPVQSRTGEELGRIVDIITDGDGHMIAAVIDFGGFLGVGMRRVAVAWDALHFDSDGEHEAITVDCTRDQIKAAPKYARDKPVTVIASGAPEAGDRPPATAPDW